MNKIDITKADFLARVISLFVVNSKPAFTFELRTVIIILIYRKGITTIGITVWMPRVKLYNIRETFQVYILSGVSVKFQVIMTTHNIEYIHVIDRKNINFPLVANTRYWKGFTTAKYLSTDIIVEHTNGATTANKRNEF